MNIQQRLFQTVCRTNWILLLVAVAAGGVSTTFEVTMGILAGGLLVTLNFHFMYRMLNKSLFLARKLSLRSILAKYYLRFGLCVVIIYVLISRNYVNAGGLLIGLSIVVVSILVAALFELKKVILKEAV